MNAAVKLKRKAKGERPYFFADPNVDKVVAMVMGLAAEVAVMRDRLDTLERLLERSGALQRSDIETYRPDAEALAERSAWRETFLAEVLRIVEIEVEALATGDTERYDSVVRLVEGGAAKPAPAQTPRAKPPSRASGSAPKRATARPVARSAAAGTTVGGKAASKAKKRARR